MKLYSRSVGVIGTNCYIVASEKNHAAIIDPGAQAGRLIEMLGARGLTVPYILLTHGHFDHIGAVNEIKAAFDAQVIIGENDAEMLTDATKSHADMRGEDVSQYIIQLAGTVKEGDCITMDELTFTVIDTPGHTRGGVCYRCGELLFTGDTLFAGDVGRTDLYGGDYQTLKQSLAKLAAIEQDLRVLPGHGEESTLAEEKANNTYLGQQDHDLYF